MFVQIELVEQFISVGHVSGVFVCLLIVYMYIRFALEPKIDNNKTDINNRVIALEEKSKVVNTLDTDFKLMQKDFEYLKKSSDNQEKSIDKIQSYLHEIKGSMAGIKMYFESLDKDR